MANLKTDDVVGGLLVLIALLLGVGGFLASNLIALGQTYSPSTTPETVTANFLIGQAVMYFLGLISAGLAFGGLALMKPGNKL